MEKKTLLEKKKTMVASIFFSHNVFFPTEDRNLDFPTFELSFRKFL